jgi:hypothetical protein
MQSGIHRQPSASHYEPQPEHYLNGLGSNFVICHPSMADIGQNYG